MEIVYTSGQHNVEIKNVYISAQTHDFRTIKGNQVLLFIFQITFLMIKGKQFVVFYFSNDVFGINKGKPVVAFYFPPFCFYD